MQKVISVSIGSSKRDHCIETKIMGQKFIIERIGTNGSINKAIDLIKKNDGKVDAIGLGGIDLYIKSGNKSYIIREALKLKNAAKITPIVDGSGLKNTLERRVIKYLQESNEIDFNKKKVLVTSGMDRFGMAESLEYYNSKLILGDLMFTLGIDKPLYSLTSLNKVANIVAPIASKLPFNLLYPTGEKQNITVTNRFIKYFNEAEIISGDFHYIKRFMPNNMKGKIIITNTVTSEDVTMLKDKGVNRLITTTPEFAGRSFGTNVMEGVIITLLKLLGKEVNEYEYNSILNTIDLKPRIEHLNEFERVI